MDSSAAVYDAWHGPPRTGTGPCNVLHPCALRIKSQVHLFLSPGENTQIKPSHFLKTRGPTVAVTRIPRWSVFIRGCCDRVGLSAAAFCGAQLGPIFTVLLLLSLYPSDTCSVSLLWLSQCPAISDSVHLYFIFKTSHMHKTRDSSSVWLC